MLKQTGPDFAILNSDDVEDDDVAMQEGGAFSTLITWDDCVQAGGEGAVLIHHYGPQAVDVAIAVLGRDLEPGAYRYVHGRGWIRQ